MRTSSPARPRIIHVLFSAFFIVFAAGCGGGGGGGGDGGGSGTTADFSGTWEGQGTQISDMCGDDGTASATITITQAGSSISVTDSFSGETFDGTVNGDTASADSSFQFPEGAGTTTVTSWEATLGSGGDSFSGVSRFDYQESGGFTCSGRVEFSATRTSGGDDGGGDGGGGSQTFNISGTVFVSSSTQVDSDTNESSGLSTPNGTFDEAQQIINPVTLGGYVNVPGSGEAGQSFSSGDVSDIYDISLTSDQNVTLTIADQADGADLDLYLFPSSCTDGTCGTNDCDFVSTTGDVARSISTGMTESLSVPSDGEYFLEVCAFDTFSSSDDASNYVLSVGQGTASVAAAGASPEAEIVPGDIIVRFKDTALPASSGNPGLHERAVALGLTARGGGAGRAMLMSIADGDRVSALDTLGVNVDDDPKRADVAARGREALLEYDTRRAIAALNERADVEYAEPNYVRRPLQVPNDPYYSLQWHYPQINLPQAWDTTIGSSNVIVAVIDTGIRDDHPDIVNQLVPGAGYDFISDPDNALDNDGIDPNPFDPGDGGGSRPSSFHGTHVAGTVAAESDNNTGVAGVAWQSRLMNLRVLGALGGSTFDIIQAIRYAAGLSNDSGTFPDQKADVINMSLGGSGSSQAAQDAVTAARNAGVVVVAAAGNESTSAPSFPAAYDGVISVSAVDINRNLSFYSNFGSTVDVAAPGGDTSVDVDGDGNPDGVWSTLWDGGPIYDFSQGTSMAAPHVAGVIALMKAVDSSLTPTNVDNLLASGQLTDDIGASGRDNLFGHGLINAFKAVDAASGGGGGDGAPVTVASPSSLNLGANGTSATFIVSNGGGGSLTGVSASASTDSEEEWLGFNSDGTDPDGLGPYQVTVDRSGLAEGSYSGQITLISNADPVEVPVIMQVFSGDANANAGRHFILLLNPSDGSTIEQAVVDAANGQYAYQFTDVPAGDYLILGGSDADNDFFVCDPGEACGAFSTLDSIVSLTLDSDKTNIDFGTSFQTNLQSSTSALTAGEAEDGVSSLPERLIRRRAAPTDGDN